MPDPAIPPSDDGFGLVSDPTWAATPYALSWGDPIRAALQTGGAGASNTDPSLGLTPQPQPAYSPYGLLGSLAQLQTWAAARASGEAPAAQADMTPTGSALSGIGTGSASPYGLPITDQIGAALRAGVGGMGADYPDPNIGPTFGFASPPRADFSSSRLFGPLLQTTDAAGPMPNFAVWNQSMSVLNPTDGGQRQPNVWPGRSSPVPYSLLGSLDQIRAWAAASRAPANDLADNLGQADGDDDDLTEAEAALAYRAPAADLAKSAGASGNASAGRAAKPLDYPERTVQSAVLRALSAMGRDGDASNVAPYTPNYAKILDPSKFDTTGWKRTFSPHSKYWIGWEAPVPGYPRYSIKYYDDPHEGHIIAVVPPTSNPEHWVLAVPSWAGYPVNTLTAEEFLKSAPRK
jgi:hypothetical protein